MKELVLTKTEGEEITDKKRGILATQRYTSGDTIVIDGEIIGILKTTKNVNVPTYLRKDVTFKHYEVEIKSDCNFRHYDDNEYTFIEEYYAVKNPKVETLLQIGTKG